MSGIVVGKTAEIPVGGRKIIVPFRGRAGIGIFNVGGAFYALRNICPHKRGPLCTGEVAGRSSADAPPSVTADSSITNARAKSCAVPGTPGNSTLPAVNVWWILMCVLKPTPSLSTATISSSI